jgi:hypothetical protein
VSVSELFPPSWFAAGLVFAGDAADFARYAAARPELSSRHWKWVAFRDWAESRERLTAAECLAAYALGEAESDRNLGIAMMCHVLYRRAVALARRGAHVRRALAAVRKAAR